ncbi:MAG: hypothetical protein JWN14_1686 [Chthonomonadales bacterium]|nr:hypothetical protein [Chthonomonadales bacterium]
MAIILRIAAVLGAIWSLIVMGLIVSIGSLISFLGFVNRTHSATFLFLAVGLEIVLLFALWHAGKLCLWAAPVILFWFVAFSALINNPFVLSEWPHHFLGTLNYFLPITLTMLVLTVHGVIAYLKARALSPQKAEAMPQLP